MRYSFTVVLAVVAALALSTSAVPIDADAQHCPVFCHKASQCNTCPTPQYLFLCGVSCVSAFSHQYAWQ
ncbi:hypothetical protein P692DRAFT_20833382 [Suillus brevipes Sb2]|nr:hypothetical protein P692DRAFT_20833382 [Suillus brevipes Sb2]